MSPWWSRALKTPLPVTNPGGRVAAGRPDRGGLLCAARQPGPAGRTAAPPPAEGLAGRPKAARPRLVKGTLTDQCGHFFASS